MTDAVSRSIGGINIALARLRLRLACKLASSKAVAPVPRLPFSVMGLRLANPIGVAAGMDTTGQLAGLVSAIGFGFLEIGSVTPRNLNSTLTNLQRCSIRPEREIVGINVSCLRGAEGDGAIRQYVNISLSCLPFADYLIINLSSPFTSQARSSGRQWCETLLGEVAASRNLVRTRTGHHVPLGLKVSMAPNDEEEALENLQIAQTLGFQGTIAVTPRDMTDSSIHETLRRAKTIIPDMTLVSVGGIASAAQVRDRFVSGAEAVQLFTGIVERGPFIARKIVSELLAEPTALAQSYGEVP